MKLTITQKLGSGFGVIILAVLISTYLTNRTGRKYQEQETRIRTEITPSRDNLTRLSDMITSANFLTQNWVFVENQTDTDNKLSLKNIHNTEFPELSDSLLHLSAHWTEGQQALLQGIVGAVQDSLFVEQKEIMKLLGTFESYSDEIARMLTPTMAENSAIIAQQIIIRVNRLEQEFSRQATFSQNQITEDFNDFQKLIMITNLILIAIVLISATYSHFSIVKPLQKIDLLIGKLATGNLSEKSSINRSDEIGMIAASVNTLVDGLRSTTSFADEIGQGHLDAEFQTLSDDDVLGNSLLNMRASLKRADGEEQKRKEEDDRRSWAAQGLAKFAEILRNNNTDMETMSQEVLFNLVRYTEANQGGIFVLNDSDPQHHFLEMRSCYAYDRKKYAEKQIEIGEGLVGACFREGSTIYMTEVPNDYVEITSGLGGDTPTAILIVPLKVNEEIFGVMELAAFTEFQPYVREFIEKVSESIASTISSLKVSERTTKLLEQAKLQAQEMAEQEEELRQNMEELQATQEEWMRKEQEYKGFGDAIDEAFPMMEMSVDFEILHINRNLERKFGISAEMMLHHQYTGLLTDTKDMNGKEYEQVWQQLRSGEMQETTGRLTIGDRIYVCRQKFMTQRNNYGEISKYLCIMTGIEPA